MQIQEAQTRKAQAPAFLSYFSSSLDSCKNSDDCRGHQIGHCASQHGANAEFGKLPALFRRERADAADLNADGAKIRETAQRKRCDRERARIERALHGA